MSTPVAAKAVKQAVRYFRRNGLDARRPINHLEAMVADRSAALQELSRTLERAAEHDLAPAIRVARIIEAPELAQPIAGAALRRPAPLEAKVEAVATLEALGVEVPGNVRETLEDVRRFVAEPDGAGLDRVLALPEAWRAPALAAWLSSGRTPVELLERLLEVAPAMDEEIIQRLGESGAASAIPVLRRLAEGADKERVKQVRRALHRLRAAGVEEPREEPEEAFSMAIDADPRDARAWSSGIDGVGGRIVWILGPSPRGGDELLEAVVDDTHGLRKAETMAVTRKGFRKHLDRLRDNPGILLVQLPIEEAARVLVGAERQAAAAGELPADYRRWRRGLGDKILAAAAATTVAEEGGTDAAPAAPTATEEPDRDAVREAVELLKDPVFANWAVLGPAAEESALGVRRAETSKLVVDDEQRKQHIDEAMAAAARSLDVEARALYRRRLEEMADLLERARRPEQARLARAAGVGFTAIDDLYASHPFARAMIQRGVLAAYQGVRERESQAPSESPIIQP